MTSNADYVTRARRVTPGGVNSPVRAFGSVGGEPRVIVRASGATVTDADGRSYVDVVSSWGPALLGHAHPAVIDAVTNAAHRGLSFGASSPDETRLAELIVDRVDPIEMVRFVSTGTEATMTAIRLARGVTGRDLLVKFSGHYHGHSDGLLAQAGSGVTTLAIPGSAGVPAAVAAQTLVIPYNAPDELEAVFARYGDRIAAVITEAAPANMGVVPPAPGFNALLADTAHRFGALLISDEVLTGFRVASDGFWGIENRATEQYRPDLITFGKVIGGGLPVAAVAGSRAIMEHLAPLGAVYQAGTLSGNPVAVAAGLATLQHATTDVYERIDRAAQIVASEAEVALRAAGVPHVVQRAGNLFSIFFGELVVGGVRSYEDAVRQETDPYAAFFHSMLDSGVWLPPSAFEAWFVSAAYDARTIERVVAALPAAARAAAAATP